jgi:hypothetical protein
MHSRVKSKRGSTVVLDFDSGSKNQSVVKEISISSNTFEKVKKLKKK